MSIRWFNFAMATALLASGTSADEPQSAADREQQNERFARLTERVPGYILKSASSEKPFELERKPVLKWTNPIRKTEAAAVFLWTHEGRAAAAMCSFWRNGREFKHEFQSLHTEPIAMMLDGEPVWTPREGGVKIESFQSAPAVAKSRRLRLIQMRRIAQEFTAVVGGGDGTTAELRLLPQPLYRYAERIDAPGVLDGAVFAYVQATDPEVLMLLEAVNRADGQSEWRIGFARMSRWRQSVHRKGETFWSCEWTAGSKDDPYAVLSYTTDDPQ